MKIIIVLALTIAVVSAFTPSHITGTTPPPVKCSNKLCHHKHNGNFQYSDPHTHKVNKNYFVQCSNGIASCQACFPLHLVFRQDCNQCLNTYDEPCATTKPWYPATTFYCPDLCPKKGYYFSGNIEDPNNGHQYVACWKGVTVGCVACPRGLKFNEKWNACLKNKKHFTPHNPHKH